MDWVTFVVVDPVKAMFIKIWSYIPAIAGAIVILVAGWLIAKVIEAVIVRVLKSIRLDVASDKANISNVLAQGEIKLSLSELIGAVIYWVVILVVIATALNALNLTIAAELISRLVGYVPNILGAIFILVLGMLLANFVASIVRTSASNAGIGSAKLLAQITHTILVIFAVILAMEQLKIASALIVLAVNVVLISVGIGLALAFGLGCKDIAGKAMQDLLNKMKK
ncbi:MAG: hypothetical protein Q8N91_07140 [Candidatus Omnitrophota bacterium]|nr:hypothetical protein [Candidatus Omnitrophota bacterium]